MKAIKIESGEYDDYKLFTGKRVPANCAILGISPKLRLYEGYDGTINEDALTIEERMEVAEYAIAMWNKYWSKCQNEIMK